LSIYDYRDRPAYGRFYTEPHYCENPYILKCWKPEHDELLINQIKKEQWVWYCEIVNEIIIITPKKIIDLWKNEDPLCKQYAWYNILMYFSASRAEKLGFTKNIKNPEWKICPLCNKKFIEDSLPYPFVKRLGINQLDFCAPCLRDILFYSGNESLSREETIIYLQDLANSIKRVPIQDFGQGIQDFIDLSTEERSKVLQILKRRPTIKWIKELFGSWLNALVESGILEAASRRATYGIECKAKDGHLCFSLGEYFGLKGNPDYDDKIREKEKICKKHNIILISVYPNDLISYKKLKGKLIKGLAL
jgi:hypothetical protein